MRIELSSGQMQQQLKVFTLMNYNFPTSQCWVIGALTLKLWERYIYLQLEIYNVVYLNALFGFLDKEENN